MNNPYLKNVFNASELLPYLNCENTVVINTHGGTLSNAFVLDNLKSDFKSYVLLLVLREIWPVGQKSKIKIRADKVGANHTYIAHICEPQVIGPSPDEKDLKKAEDSSLSSQLSFLMNNKKRFANSSAIHEFIRQNR